MKKLEILFVFSLLLIFLTACAGIKYLTIETQEPAQVTLPKNVKSVIIVNNVVQQPNDIGHNILKVGNKEMDRTKASSDSIAIFYAEALSQFLSEEEYFTSVMYNKTPLREDNNFWTEELLSPEQMNELKKKSGADAVISLDKLIMQTDMREHFKQEGYSYGNLMAKIQSTLRIYLPTMEGKIPSIEYKDSLLWEGYDAHNRRVPDEIALPSREEAMKKLAIRAAEKMTYTLAPHWIAQDRWYYTLSDSKMKEGAILAQNMQWQEAANRWETFYNNEKNNGKKAKAASNIALAYEMLGDMNKAHQWISEAYNLFVKSSGKGSLDTKRALLYKNEIERRKDNSNSLNMQMNEEK